MCIYIYVYVYIYVYKTVKKSEIKIFNWETISTIPWLFEYIDVI